VPAQLWLYTCVVPVSGQCANAQLPSIGQDLVPDKTTFVQVVEWAGNVRDVSVVGWQTANFGRYWMQQIGVLLVRERAKVGSAAAKGGWPRRARRANALGGMVTSAV
jgi:hypothetical protein